MKHFDSQKKHLANLTDFNASTLQQSGVMVCDDEGSVGSRLMEFWTVLPCLMKLQSLMQTFP